MIYKNDISNIKNEIGEKIGQKIIVKGSLGRNKPFEEEAIIKHDAKEEARLSSIRNVMKNLKISAEEAMKVLEIPEADYMKYKAML